MILRIETRDGGVRFSVLASPRASRTEVAGEHDGALRIRLAAPPVEGEANAELIAFLAKRLRVPRSTVRIEGGERGRRKLVAIDGVDAAAVRRALQG